MMYITHYSIATEGVREGNIYFSVLGLVIGAQIIQSLEINPDFIITYKYRFRNVKSRTIHSYIFDKIFYKDVPVRSINSIISIDDADYDVSLRKIKTEIDIEEDPDYIVEFYARSFVVEYSKYKSINYLAKVQSINIRSADFHISKPQTDKTITLRSLQNTIELR